MASFLFHFASFDEGERLLIWRVILWVYLKPGIFANFKDEKCGIIDLIGAQFRDFGETVSRGV